MKLRSVVTRALAALLATGALAVPSPLAPFVEADAPTPIVTTEVVEPPGGDGFDNALVLPNGNIVAVDQGFSVGGYPYVGAIMLFDGGSHELISVVTGSRPRDLVGSGDIVVVGDSNAVVASPSFDLGAGAATFVDGTQGATGTVGLGNSFIGGRAGDGDFMRIHVLTQGNYLIALPYADLGAVDSGAVVWGSGSTGVHGLPDDVHPWRGHLGSRLGNSVTVLSNGNAVIADVAWGTSGVPDAGAVGLVLGGAAPEHDQWLDETNALVGVAKGQMFGADPIVPLTNGNYVVINSNVGTATWRSGTDPAGATINTASSITTVSNTDGPGLTAVALADGDYVVVAPRADMNGVVDVGAARWAPGTGPTSAYVTSGVIGASAHDGDGMKATPLVDGSYVVAFPQWDQGVHRDRGAVIWEPGDRASTGTPTFANAFVGVAAGDNVGAVVTSLTDGNYVVGSPNALRLGAATWRAGGRQDAGIVGPDNSLLGVHVGDRTGVFVAPLAGGAYLVGSDYWSNGIAQVGAVSWQPAGGRPGLVTATNSLVGAAIGDGAAMGLLPLPNGDAVVHWASWSAGGNAVGAGAVTYVHADGRGAAGVVSAANSLVGGTAGDRIGGDSIVPLGGGEILVVSASWSVPGGAPTGAATLVQPGEMTGTVGTDRSVTGRLLWRNFVGHMWRRTASGDWVVPVGGRAALLHARTVSDGGGGGAGGGAAGSGFVSLVPARLVESRTGAGLGAVDGVLSGIGVRGAGSVTEVQVSGRGGVPAGATAVVVDVSVVDARGPGFVTVFPCGSARPNAASATYAAGQTISNTAVVGLSASGSVCVFTYADIDLVVDVTGAYTSASSLSGVVPARLVESRVGAGLGTVDGVSSGIGVRGAGSVTEVQVAGRGGVPVGAVAAVLNVSVVDARGPGFVTVFPCGSARPNAASATYAAGQTISNTAVVALSASGSVCVFTYADIDLVVDVTGAYTSASSLSGVVPARLVESRVGAGLGTVDGVSSGIGVRGAGSVTEVQVAGRGGVPAGAVAAVLNVSVVDARGPGFVTVFACGGERPNAASATYAAGQTISNTAVVALSATGTVCVYTHADIDLVIDVTGSIPA